MKTLFDPDKMPEEMFFKFRNRWRNFLNQL